MVRRSVNVRLGGLALSFVALGLLLLVGAFAYQRFRPAEEAEEREPQASV